MERETDGDDGGGRHGDDRALELVDAALEGEGPDDEDDHAEGHQPPDARLYDEVVGAADDDGLAAFPVDAQRVPGVEEQDPAGRDDRDPGDGVDRLGFGLVGEGEGEPQEEDGAHRRSEGSRVQEEGRDGLVAPPREVQRQGRGDGHDPEAKAGDVDEPVGGARGEAVADV